ncbi:hypothetical protein BC629DRAFT_1438069 [Irpex lacteus]|nr:hypothetical protein BC629DRAFT_1438069 [Irpex lacteus]
MTEHALGVGNRNRKRREKRFCWGVWVDRAGSLRSPVGEEGVVRLLCHVSGLDAFKTMPATRTRRVKLDWARYVSAQAPACAVMCYSLLVCSQESAVMVRYGRLDDGRDMLDLARVAVATARPEADYDATLTLVARLATSTSWQHTDVFTRALRCTVMYGLYASTTREKLKHWQLWYATEDSLILVVRPSSVTVIALENIAASLRSRRRPGIYGCDVGRMLPSSADEVNPWIMRGACTRKRVPSAGMRADTSIYPRHRSQKP